MTLEQYFGICVIVFLARVSGDRHAWWIFSFLTITLGFVVIYKALV